MEVDLNNLDEENAMAAVILLVDQLDKARAEAERSQRRVAGLRKMIDALVEMFPAAEDVLPEALDDDEEPRPRGAEAIRRVLAEREGHWYTVAGVVDALEKRDWLPNSSNPANAVRTALERLVEAKVLRKGRSAQGSVVYSYSKPAPDYDYGEEPF